MIVIITGLIKCRYINTYRKKYIKHIFHCNTDLSISNLPYTINRQCIHKYYFYFSFSKKYKYKS